MNTWNQGQNQNQNNMMFSPYNWATMPRYNAAPIHGENAAWQFPMGPSSEIYLPDADQDIIWWIRTDGAGIRTVQAFDVKPHESPAPIDTNDLAERLAAVEEWINAKQNKPNARTNSNIPTDSK